MMVTYFCWPAIWHLFLIMQKMDNYKILAFECIQDDYEARDQFK